jgi:hypothetical protein
VAAPAGHAGRAFKKLFPERSCPVGHACRVNRASSAPTCTAIAAQFERHMNLKIMNFFVPSGVFAAHSVGYMKRVPFSPNFREKER